MLIKLATEYDVSTDYLLGLTDVTTTDRDLKFICDYTGLSESLFDSLLSEKMIFNAMDNGSENKIDNTTTFYFVTIQLHLILHNYVIVYIIIKNLSSISKKDVKIY